MNYKMVGRFMFLIIITEAIFMVPAWLISLVSGEDASASAFCHHDCGCYGRRSAGADVVPEGRTSFLRQRRTGECRLGMDCDESGGMYPFHAVRGDTDVY